MYDMTTFTSGQDGWTLNERAAFFAGEGHGDLSLSVIPGALTVSGTLNGDTSAKRLFRPPLYRGRARVILSAVNADGDTIYSVASETGYEGDFTLSIPHVVGAAENRITVVSFPARSSYKTYGAGVVNLRAG